MLWNFSQTRYGKNGEVHYKNPYISNDPFQHLFLMENILWFWNKVAHTPIFTIRLGAQVCKAYQCFCRPHTLCIEGVF